MVTVVRCGLTLRRHAALRRHILRHKARAVPPQDRLAEIAWAIAAVARRVPGATCLTQATAGQWVLARRGYGSVVRISVPPLDVAEGGIAPHAWLIATDIVALGGTAAQYRQHRILHDFRSDEAAG